MKTGVGLRIVVVGVLAVFGGGAGTAAADEVVGRTEFSETTRKGQAFETTVSPAPLHFREDGRWRRIDTSLEPAGGGAVSATAVAGDVEIPPTAGGQVVVEHDGAEVSLKLAGASGGARTVEGDTASFTGVLPGVSASYTATARGVKEIVRLGQFAPRALRYDVQIPAGWEIASADGGSLAVRDGAGKARFHISAPVAWDSAADPSYTNALALDAAEDADGRWTVTLTPDAQWLDDPARVWPVHVDPDVAWAHLYTAADSDCFVASGDQADDNFCDLEIMKTGRDSRTYNSLIKWDLSSIPAQATVTAATMFVFQTLPQADLPYPGWFSYHTARTLTSSWDPSTVTWNGRNATTSWATPGGDVSNDPDLASPYSFENFIGGVSIFQPSVPIAAVQGWVDGTLPNYGFQLTAANTAVVPFAFSTYETTLAGPEARRPHITVVWNQPATADTTPPSPPSAITVGDADSSGDIDVSWAASTDPAPGSGVSSYSLSWDSQRMDEWSAPIVVSGTSATIVGPQPDDVLEVRVRAIDSAGNQSDVAEAETTVAPTTPELCDPETAVESLPAECQEDPLGTGDDAQYELPIDLNATDPGPEETAAPLQGRSAAVSGTRYNVETGAEACRDHRCWTTIRSKETSWSTGSVRVNSSRSDAQMPRVDSTFFMYESGARNYLYGSFSWNGSCGWIDGRKADDPRDGSSSRCNDRPVRPHFSRWQAKAFGGTRTGVDGQPKKIRGNNCYGTKGQYVSPSASGCAHGSAIFLAGPTVQCADVGLTYDGNTRKECLQKDTIRKLDKSSEWSGYCVNWRYVTKDQRWVMVRDNREIYRGGWVFIKRSALAKNRATWPGINDRGTCRMEAKKDPDGIFGQALITTDPEDEDGPQVGAPSVECEPYRPEECNAVVEGPDGCGQCVIS